MMEHSLRGSLWHRWDLHFHTPSSFDYGNKAITDEQIVERLKQEGVRVVAITDHHVMDVTRIRHLQELAGDAITFLPGMELRSYQGSPPINYICIFPENCNLEHIWTTLQGKLGLTPEAVAKAGGDERVYVPIELGAEEVHRLGGAISIHAGRKSNSIEGISNREQFQQQIKYDITNKYVDIMEIGQVRDVDVHLQTIFPTTKLDKPLAICSDCHDINDYRVKAPLWFRADPTFRGLLMVLREPRDRVFIGTRPPEVVRVEQNKTKYIKSVTFARKAGAPASEQWFSGTITFSSGLVAIVGNKGSGKSALADTLGLLGATKNAGAFSFLSKDRFRHPRASLAGHFDACLEWESGEQVTKGLADAIEPDALERLKYLPQDHVERVCNELAGLGEEGFERELKAVIFSHVPEPERLGHSSLDELVQFRTGEKQKRIDSLVAQLRSENRARAGLEAQADPLARRELAERIRRREVEIEAHDGAKPTEVLNPASGAPAVAPDASALAAIAAAEGERRRLEAEIASAGDVLTRGERRQAVARRLLERLDNFSKDVAAFMLSLEAEAVELGVKAADLASVAIHREAVEAIRDEAARTILATKLALDAAEPPGLRAQLGTSQATLAGLQSQLDAPNRAYQAYLTALGEWKSKREALVGSATDPESLTGLKASLTALDELPAKIVASKGRQRSLALEVHAEKVAQADVYRELYGSVQGFIDSHILAKDKLKLEFRAELVNEDFAGRLLGLLALNRKGSFMGVDEGRARAIELVQSTRWDDRGSVGTFLDRCDAALHADQREGQGTEVQIRDQLLKGRKPEEVFDLVYGLDYIRPRYILRWEGKDLSMLSPGERGTLLLVFYLLIDKSDMPLVMDQPEGNLDNHTVAKVLVECIKEARKRRQVFIVTHNPNLAVVCDADQVVHASIDKANGNAITYASGSLENPAMSKYVTDVLEGTRWAFDVRGSKYEVSR